jgi:hypothetical protein
VVLLLILSGLPATAFARAPVRVLWRVLPVLIACAPVALRPAANPSPVATPVASRELYRSPQFVITDTSVIQGRFEAVAVSPDTIVSTYPRSAREVMFKFCINGEENEFVPGLDHMFYVRPRGGRIVTPVYTFGQLDPPYTPRPEDAPPPPGEEGVASVTIRVDMRHVMESFRTRGEYKPPNGPPIRADQFHGVYIAGNAEPLTWEFSALRPGSRFQLHDPDGDGIFDVTLPFETAYTRPADPAGRAIWVRRRDLGHLPELTSSQRLLDALHRMSLEELLDLRREDGALAAGAKWPGVWTRDVSWGAMLALSPILPDAVRISLMAKVDGQGRIIQDTGTGGSWPISTDRVAWALAAWELYAVTGDRGWLRTAYDIIRRSTEADLLTAFDAETGLFRGESSFLDWREQSYPTWMDPKDIYLSQALGTNALHHGTYRVLARMARALGEPAEVAARHEEVSQAVRRGMNTHLWQPDRGYYGQFRYGRVYLSRSPCAEGLGEALSILYGAADPEQRQALARRMPVVSFGVPSFWPYIPDMPPYHNAAIWPQVVGFWSWAAAESGNTAAVEHGLASLFRAAALFLTNKENMVAATGHFEGTELNSDRLIGSVGGTLGAIHRVLFGMRFHEDRLAFHPFVPRAYAGERTLRNLRYRRAELTVIVRGFGNGVERAVLDGRPIERAEIPGDLTGTHQLEIALNGVIPGGEIQLVENRSAPRTPQVALEGDRLVWAAVPTAVRYTVFRNGRPVGDTADRQAPIERGTGLSEYQVLATDSAGLDSFLSEPVRVVPPGAELIIQPAGAALEKTVAGHTGPGYVRLTTERNTEMRLTARVPVAGVYSIDVRYANGSGPINSADQAAVRTLLVDGKRAGALVLPQRGIDLWDDWGYSSSLRARLTAGVHILTIRYTESDRNMNGVVNTALLDHVRLTRLDGDLLPGPRATGAGR